MKTNSLFKRLVSMLIVVLMICTLFPVTALAEAGDWDPTTSPDDVEGTLVGNKTFTSSFTFNISTSSNAELRAMPILNDGRYSYNAMAYCGASASSNNNDIIEVKSVDIGTYSGGIWDGADCLQFNCELKSPGTAIVTAYYYYTFSQSQDPFNNPNAQWFYATHTFRITVNKDYTLSYDANGGTGAPQSQTKTVAASSCDFTVSSQKPTWEDHTFLGWAEDSNAQTAQYTAGQKITVQGNKTLYAVWQDNTPSAPTENDLGILLAGNAVKIDCVNTEVSHEDKTYGLISGTYSIGNVIGDATNGYTCTVTVNSAKYIEQYNTDIKVAHSLAAGETATKNITLEYKDKAWVVKTGSAPVTFTVMCETPATTYTVTYKDGVGGKVFADQSYSDLSYGDATPLFQGSLARKGYVFAGWTPAVSGTVTGNATYVATWRKVNDTVVIEIGGGNSSSGGEENPNTGAPVFVGVAIGALAAAK